MVNLSELVKDIRNREYNILEKWKMTSLGIHERFMITYCPKWSTESDLDTLLMNHDILKRIFRETRRQGIECEFTVEYGTTNRLHYHIIVMLRHKSAAWTFNNVVWPKLRENGYLKKSPYHDGLDDYLYKEAAATASRFQDVPIKFSTETLNNWQP